MSKVKELLTAIETLNAKSVLADCSVEQSNLLEAAAGAEEQIKELIQVLTEFQLVSTLFAAGRKEGADSVTLGGRPFQAIADAEPVLTALSEDIDKTEPEDDRFKILIPGKDL